MTEKVGRPTDQQPDEWQRDLNPEPRAGLNHGMEGANPEKEAPMASDIKELHQFLEGFSNNDLKQIPILKPGSQLKEGATYINLKDPLRQEFTAVGGMMVGDRDWIVPKTDVEYPLWNRLIGVDNPERTDEGR